MATGEGNTVNGGDTDLPPSKELRLGESERLMGRRGKADHATSQHFSVSRESAIKPH